MGQTFSDTNWKWPDMSTYSGEYDEREDYRCDGQYYYWRNHSYCRPRYYRKHRAYYEIPWHQRNYFSSSSSSDGYFSDKEIDSVPSSKLTFSKDETTSSTLTSTTPSSTPSPVPSSIPSSVPSAPSSSTPSGGGRNVNVNIYDRIKNPDTNRLVSIHSRKGKEILNKYSNIIE